MKLQELVQKIDDNLPIELVSDQDNVGLMLGDYDDECEKMILAYEMNSGVLDEALESSVNLVVTYHTPVFRPRKSFTSSSSEPDTLFEAARAGVNIFAVHSALDIIRDGLNFDLAARLGLQNVRFLSPIKKNLYKIAVFVPTSHADKVREAMSRAGAGRIGNYSDCAFTVEGKGSFVPNDKSSPSIGEPGKLERVDETRLEMIAENSLLGPIVEQMLSAHPYEEVAYDIYPLVNNSVDFGFGAVGELDASVPLREFLSRTNKILELNSVKVSHSPEARIKKVALCAGSGVPFYNEAVRGGADIFITGDVKHHDFREAQSCRTILVDATHSGSERFVPEVMFSVLKAIFLDKIAIEKSRFKTTNAITI